MHELLYIVTQGTDKISWDLRKSKGSGEGPHRFEIAEMIENLASQFLFLTGRHRETSVSYNLNFTN